MGLSQTQIAEGLGISPSYVNLIERNQRPVTAQILLRLAETYDLDLRDLATADEDRFFAELNEIFSDPLFRQIDVPKQELRDLAELCPGVTHALQRLYAAYTEARQGETLAAAQMADRDVGTRYEANPVERVRELIEANRNYFPELEQAAENLRDELNVPAEGLYAALAARLREKHSIQTRIMPVDVMRETLAPLRPPSPPTPDLRAGRPARPRLPARLPAGPRRMRASSGDHHQPRRPARRRAAAAVPHHARQLFCGGRDDALPGLPRGGRSLDYDIHVLAQRFNSGFEQVCHRLTTLQRPNARGIPFFLLRVDNAGNVSKRFSSGTFPFSKFGGTCPLWNVHSTFDTPDRLLKQVIELSDGTRYFSIAQMVRRPVAPHPLPQPRFAIGLGCEIRHAARLTYAAGMDLEKTEGTPIGVNCRLCERENCAQRAEPPITRTLILDETTRRVSSFAFSNAREL